MLGRSALVLGLGTQHKNIFIERGKEKGEGDKKGRRGVNLFK
jgi:hypothetical protein